LPGCCGLLIPACGAGFSFSLDLAELALGAAVGEISRDGVFAKNITALFAFDGFYNAVLAALLTGQHWRGIGHSAGLGLILQLFGEFSQAYLVGRTARSVCAQSPGHLAFRDRFNAGCSSGAAFDKNYDRDKQANDNNSNVDLVFHSATS
jgi:hypothetical protein